MKSFSCDQCEEDFELEMINECETCGGSYCKHCSTNHELCVGEEFDE